MLFSKNKQIFALAVKFEFNTQNRLRLYMKLAQLLENGVPLDSALLQIQQASTHSKGSALPILYARWRRNVANGKNFGQVVAQYVPSTEAILLETGADSGHLADALRNAAETVEQQTKVKNAIISNSAYPGILFAMLVAALVLSSNMVIPTFAEILPVDQWTGPAAVVAKVSVLIKDYGILLLIAFCMLVALVTVSLSRWTGKERRFVENIVPWSLYRMWQGSSLLLSISAMMYAGIKLDEVSLGRIGKNADPYLAQRINAVKRRIVSGANLGDALYQTGYRFPEDELIADLRIYARLRNFDKNIVRITRTWVEDLVKKVEVTMRGFNLVMLVLIAVVIGFLISALYGVVQQIQTAP